MNGRSTTSRQLSRIDEITSSEPLHPSGDGSGSSEYSPDGDLETLHQLNDTIYHLRFRASGRLAGPVVSWLKRMLRQLLTPILVRQLHVNAAATRLIAHAIGAERRLGEEIARAIDAARSELAASVSRAEQEQSTMTDVYRVSLGRRIDGVVERGRVELERTDARLTERIEALAAQQEQIVQVLEQLVRGSLSRRPANGGGPQ